jgi:hypothetical protein
MRHLNSIFALLTLGFAGALFTSPAQAQDPYADYNRARAYQQYLNSPARVRTFSSLQSGRVWGYDTPLESGRFWVTPGYYHEQTSPLGREFYAVPARPGGIVVRRPLLVYPPVVVAPGYPYPW